MAKRSESKTLCSKCKVNDRVAGQAWCADCFAGYQKSYAQTKLVQERGQGFGEGVDAMREMLALEFARIGVIRVSGDEVSKAIRLAPRPQLKGS